MCFTCIVKQMNKVEQFEVELGVFFIANSLAGGKKCFISRHGHIFFLIFLKITDKIIVFYLIHSPKKGMSVLTCILGLDCTSIVSRLGVNMDLKSGSVISAPELCMSLRLGPANGNL